MLTFQNLRTLSVRTSGCETILPSPEFFSSITSTRLSEITIDITVYPPSEELDRALDVIKGYDEALCRLSTRLKPSPGREKLVLTLRVVEVLTHSDAFLPRFSETGVLQIVGMGL